MKPRTITIKRHGYGAILTLPSGEQVPLTVNHVNNLQDDIVNVLGEIKFGPGSEFAYEWHKQRDKERAEGAQPVCHNTFAIEWHDRPVCENTFDAYVLGMKGK